METDLNLMQQVEKRMFIFKGQQISDAQSLDSYIPDVAQPVSVRNSTE